MIEDGRCGDGYEWLDGVVFIFFDIDFVIFVNPPTQKVPCNRNYLMICL